MPSQNHLIGKTVAIDAEAFGVIIDVTEHSVGIQLDGEGFRVLYIPIAALEPVIDPGECDA